MTSNPERWSEEQPGQNQSLPVLLVNTGDGSWRARHKSTGAAASSDLF